MSSIAGFRYKKDSPFRRRVRAMFDGRDPSDVIEMLRVEGKRWIDICEILGCNITTIHRHIRKYDLGFFNQTEEGRRIKSESAKRFQEKVKRGEVPTYKRGGWTRDMFGFARRRR
jgi:hypothetical protein